MNIIESQKLHDLMQGAYERSRIASTPKNYLPAAIGEFAKEIAINPLLENLRLEIAKMGKEALIPLVRAKLATLAELEHARQLLDSYKEIIPALTSLLEECEQIKQRCPTNSNEMIYDIVPIIKKAVYLILWNHPKTHKDILDKLVTLDDKNKVIEYIFVPSLHHWYQERAIFERTKKTSVSQSCHYLIQLYLFYDIKTRQNKILSFMQNNHHSAVYYLDADAKNFDEALEERNVVDAVKLGFDIEECKSHMHRIWEFIKPTLIKKKNSSSNSNNKSQTANTFYYQYSEKSGIRQGWFFQETEKKEHLEGVSAALLHCLIKKKNPMPKDEIAEKICDHTSKAKPKEQVRNAVRTVNNKLKKYFLENIIITAANGNWTINSMYATHIMRKK